VFTTTNIPSFGLIDPATAKINKIYVFHDGSAWRDDSSYVQLANPNLQGDLLIVMLADYASASNLYDQYCVIAVDITREYLDSSDPEWI
jgi:hypothetical protein